MNESNIDHKCQVSSYSTIKQLNDECPDNDISPIHTIELMSDNLSGCDRLSSIQTGSQNNLEKSSPIKESEKDSSEVKNPQIKQTFNKLNRELLKQRSTNDETLPSEDTNDVIEKYIYG